MGSELKVVLYSAGKDTPEGSSSDFTVDHQFNARMNGCDFGPRVEAEFGDFDYEYWFALKPEATRALLVALVNERFGGRRDAISEFSSFLDSNKIDAEFGWWH